MSIKTNNLPTIKLLFIGYQIDFSTVMSAEFINRIINHAIVPRETIKTPVKRSRLDYVAIWIATCGIGYMPIVPATWGSLVGVGIYLLAQKATVWAEELHLTNTLLISITLICLIALSLIGVWASARIVKITGKKDPRIVIIDEVVGQLITFLFVPAKLGWWTVAAGFLAFRFFDILKPYPANRLEALPSGWGVMADDIMAGFYAAAFMYLVVFLNLMIF